VLAFSPSFSTRQTRFGATVLMVSVDQRDQPGHVLAALQVPRGEAAPAPLVLQLVEAVLRVRPVPVELGDRANLKIERRRQNRELPDPRARLRVGPEQIALAVVAARQRHRPG